MAANVQMPLDGQIYFLRATCMNMPVTKNWNCDVQRTPCPVLTLNIIEIVLKIGHLRKCARNVPRSIEGMTSLTTQAFAKIAKR